MVYPEFRVSSSVLMKGNSSTEESAKAGCCNFLCLGTNNNSHQLQQLVGEQGENTICPNRIPPIYPLVVKLSPLKNTAQGDIM